MQREKPLRGPATVSLGSAATVLVVGCSAATHMRLREITTPVCVAWNFFKCASTSCWNAAFCCCLIPRSLSRVLCGSTRTWERSSKAREMPICRRKGAPSPASAVVVDSMSPIVFAVAPFARSTCINTPPSKSIWFVCPGCPMRRLMAHILAWS